MADCNISQLKTDILCSRCDVDALVYFRLDVLQCPTLLDMMTFEQQSDTLEITFQDTQWYSIHQLISYYQKTALNIRSSCSWLGACILLLLQYLCQFLFIRKKREKPWTMSGRKTSSGRGKGLKFSFIWQSLTTKPSSSFFFVLVYLKKKTSLYPH